MGWKFHTVPYNFYRLVTQSYVHLYVGVNFIHTNPFLIAIDSLNMQSWICRGEFYSYKPFFIAIDSLNVQSWICNHNNFLPPLRFHKWTAGWGHVWSVWGYIEKVLPLGYEGYPGYRMYIWISCFLLTR